MRSAIGWIVAVAAMSVVSGAVAQEPLRLQLKWVPQAQFAGYYVAKAKGFYRDVGLEVTLLPGGPDVAPSEVIAKGGADAIVEWLPAALAAREKGTALVNIAQMFTHSGMMLTCRKETGIRQPADLKGRTLGVWYAGNEYPFLSWMNRLDLKVAGPAPDVKVLRQGLDVALLLAKQADCISTMTYNEYGQVIDGGLKADDLVLFKYEEMGVATLEDGLYTTSAKLEEPLMFDRLARFVAASLRGWDEAIKTQPEAVKAVLEADTARAQTEAHQTRMLAEVAKLAGGSGYLDLAAYDRTVATLLSGGSEPVITRRPIGAWTHAIWEAARRYRK